MQNRTSSFIIHRYLLTPHTSRLPLGPRPCSPEIAPRGAIREFFHDRAQLPAAQDLRLKQTTNVEIGNPNIPAEINVKPGGRGGWRKPSCPSTSPVEIYVSNAVAILETHN